MATTRWTSRINPASWLLRRRPREAPVAPGGQAEFRTPPAYSAPPQDDYSAGDRPALSDSGLEWFAEAGDADSDIPLTLATKTMNPPRPRTRAAGYKDGTLSIEFRDGAVYQYTGITPAQWASLQSDTTQSTGKWMQRNGIGGRGSGVRVN